ncbi:MAG: PQQ-like beta-propeller repeat protein [Spirochaetaceae bacterium]|nr:MAG: PQQ-like beta-propeller repeat protein [Spirochaetaceae bacterium]
MSEREEKRSAAFAIHLFRRIAVVSGFIAAVLCILLLINYLQLQRTDPLNSPALEALIGRLRENPEDTDLREEIRALDLLARRAYFTRIWQIRVASLMLLGSVSALIVSLKILSRDRQKLPAESGETTSLRTAFLSRFGLMVMAAVLLASGLAAAVLSDSALSRDYAVGGNGDGPIQESEAAVAQDTEIKENYLDTEVLRRNWPGFRGPGGVGIAYVADAPTQWNGSTGQGVVWKTAIPKPGFNSPIIWEDRIFLSGADEQSREVYCLDRHSGAIFWQSSVDNVPGSPTEAPQVSSDTGYAAPTMATDGARVFAIFATGDVVGLDFAGVVVWERNLGVPENHYGHSSSLMVYRDLLIVQYDHDGGARLLALDTANGQTVWETERQVMTSWTSPILVYTGRRPEVILNANPYVAAYDPDSGRELWQVECMFGEVGPSPAYGDGLVYAANQFAQLVAIDVNTREIVWELYDDLPDASSPLAVEGCVYVPTSYGYLSCLDAKTGEIYWIHDYGGSSYSSPVYAAGRIYWMDKSGVMHIFEAGTEFIPISDPTLGEPSWAVPAFTDSRIYIRGEQHLYCIGG